MKSCPEDELKVWGHEVDWETRWMGKCSWGWVKWALTQFEDELNVRSWYFFHIRRCWCPTCIFLLFFVQIGKIGVVCLVEAILSLCFFYPFFLVCDCNGGRIERTTSATTSTVTSSPSEVKYRFVMLHLIIGILIARMFSDDALYQNVIAVINFPLYQPSLCANAKSELGWLIFWSGSANSKTYIQKAEKLVETTFQLRKIGGKSEYSKMTKFHGKVR